MSVAFVTGMSNPGESAAATSFNNITGYTAVGGATHVMVLAASWNADPGAITTMTWNGTPMTKFGSTIVATAGAIAFFFLINPAAGAKILNLVWTNSVSSCFLIGEFSGIDTSTPLANLNSATGNSSTPAVSITTKSGDAAMDAFTIAAVSGIASAGQTIIGDVAGSVNSYGNSYGLAVGTAVSFSWSLYQTNNWLDAGVDIQAPGATSIPVWPIGM